MKIKNQKAQKIVSQNENLNFKITNTVQKQLNLRINKPTSKKLS